MPIASALESLNWMRENFEDLDNDELDKIIQIDNCRSQIKVERNDRCACNSNKNIKNAKDSS